LESLCSGSGMPMIAAIPSTPPLDLGCYRRGLSVGSDNDALLTRTPTAHRRFAPAGTRFARRRTRRCPGRPVRPIASRWRWTARGGRRGPEHLGRPRARTARRRAPGGRRYRRSCSARWIGSPHKSGSRVTATYPRTGQPPLSRPVEDCQGCSPLAGARNLGLDDPRAVRPDSLTLQFRRPEHPGLPSDCSNAAQVPQAGRTVPRHCSAPTSRPGQSR
jgi:hypothetical protein